jgi:RNA polymerase sigma-70 factor (ECF subfamily)
MQLGQIPAAPAPAAPALADRSIAEAYESYTPELRRYATARLRDSAAAEDVVQEAFVRLTVESAAGRAPHDPRAWLYRVVLNLIISGSRRAEVARRRSGRLALDDVELESPEVACLATERQHALATALQAAGAAGQTSLRLAAQGYTGREIARVLGRSEGATRTLICRARSQVRRELAASYAEVA